MPRCRTSRSCQRSSGNYTTMAFRLFDFGSEPDAKDSMMEIAGTDQGGLGLPDRDYYLKTDAKSVELRNQYVQHVTNMFQLLGEPPEKAAADAKTVLNIETQLATASMDRVERRDPNKVYHKMTTAQLQQLKPCLHPGARTGPPSCCPDSSDSLDVRLLYLVQGHPSTGCDQRSSRTSRPTFAGRQPIMRRSYSQRRL